MANIAKETFLDWRSIGDQIIKCSNCKFNFVLPMVSVIVAGNGTNRGIKKLWDSTLSRKKQNIHIVAFMFPETKICRKCYKTYERKGDGKIIIFENRYWEKLNRDFETQALFGYIENNTMKKDIKDINECNCGRSLMEFKKCPSCSSELLFSNIEFDGVPIIIQ